MSLQNQKAEEVSFDCEKCRTSHGLIRIRWHEGKCRKCSGTTFSMITVYREVESRFDANTERAVRLTFGKEIGRIASREMTMHRERTDGVSGEEALRIARSGLFLGAYRTAFELMQSRKELEMQQHREKLQSGGGGNCVVCGSFYVVTDDKPWTKAQCCTKLCHKKIAGPGEVVDEPAPSQPAPAEPGRRSLPVICACGHTYQVAATFVGARRACPQCGAKNVVSD